MTRTLRSALEDYRKRVQLTTAAILAVKRAAPRGPEAVAAVLAAYQVLAIQQGAAAVPAMAAEQGLSTAATAGVAASALAGVTSAGYPLSAALQTVGAAAELSQFVATQLADAARNGAFLGMVSTPSVTTWVRMLQPPSCSRCVILAGVEYRSKEIAGFDRHEQCDCIAVPSSEALADDLATDPKAYFESLSPEEQDRIFTQAGAEAIRLGADMNQVVNARRGMRKAQVFGREAWVTLEGMTRRGIAGQTMRLPGGSRRPVRLMPETILALARGDRDEAIRLLRLHAYLL